MSLQRITRIQVAIVGLALAVGVALVFTIILISPQKKKISRAIGEAELAEEIGRTRPAVEQQLADAEAMQEEVGARYKKIMDERMPKLDFTDPIASTLRMWDLGAEEQKVMDQWFASTGATVTGYSFPSWGTGMPSSFPNASAKMLDPLSWNLTVQVKSLDALFDWLMLLPKAPRFMVMQSVTIQGPHRPGEPLVAQIPVTLYQWTGVEPAAVAGASGTAAGTGRAGGAVTRGGAGTRSERAMRGERGGRRGRRGGNF